MILLSVGLNRFWDSESTNMKNIEYINEKIRNQALKVIYDALVKEAETNPDFAEYIDIICDINYSAKRIRVCADNEARDFFIKLEDNA